MKKLLGPLVAVVATVGILWVAKELKGLGSIEFGILDEDDPEEEESLLEAIQRYGDYAEAVGSEVDASLTLADLEGIGVPDLTTIVEDLKRDAMDPVDKSVVDGAIGIEPEPYNVQLANQLKD